MSVSVETPVDLTLDVLDDLFVARPADPLNGRFDARSGFEYLLENVAPSREAIRVRISLAGENSVRYTDEGIAAAIAGYASARLDRVGAELARIRRLAFKELAFGVVFLALCLVVSSVLAGVGITPDWLRDFFVEGLVIIGWIALWHPVDMLFFERLPLIRERRILHRLHSAQVEVRRRDRAARA